MNFRQLVDEWRSKGRRYDPPRTMAEVSEATDVSVPHLYALFAGEKVAQECTVNKIARGLGVSSAKVQAALDLTLEEAEVTS